MLFQSSFVVAAGVWLGQPVPSILTSVSRRTQYQERHQSLAEIANIVRPETILTWHRRLIGRKFDLKRHGIPPAPERKGTTPWKDFIRAHLEMLAATDFFTTEVWMVESSTTGQPHEFLDHTRSRGQRSSRPRFVHGPGRQDCDIGDFSIRIGPGFSDYQPRDAIISQPVRPLRG